MGYFEALFLGLGALFQWPAFGLFLIGIAVGLMLGILPGVGTSLGFAVMLPFIADMTAVQAFAFLLGMSAAMGVSGDITAVLVGVPGQRSATAVIIDGHAMVKNGEPGRALGATNFGSLFGGLIGVVFVFLLIPVVRPLVLALGNPEFFMLIVLAICFIAALSREQLVNGFLSAGMGFTLGMIGQSRITGESRFTFGLPELWEGFPLEVLGLGIFAIPEIVQLALKRTSIAGELADEETDLQGVRAQLRGLQDNLRHWKLIVKSCGIGAFMGMLPGLGSSAVQWVVYSFAKSTSKEPELFGHGAPEGIIAPSAATCADDGGALITTVAFGIPGGITMAFILGAFITVGYAPGPSMLGPHLDVTMSMVWTLAFGHIIAVAACIFAARPMLAVTRIRGTLVLPILLALIALGAYLSTFSMVGLLLTFALGVLGYLMSVFNWPRAPMILAFVLAPIAENYFFLTTQIYGATGWLTRPIVMLVIVMIVGYLIYIVRRPVDKRKASQREADRPTVSQP